MSCCDIRNQWQCKLNWCQTEIPTTKIFSAQHRGKKPSKDLCWIPLFLCELKKKRCWKRHRSSLIILHFHFILCPHYPGLFFFLFGLLRKLLLFSHRKSWFSFTVKCNQTVLRIMNCMFSSLHIGSIFEQFIRNINCSPASSTDCTCAQLRSKGEAWKNLKGLTVSSLPLGFISFFYLLLSITGKVQS